MMVLKRNLISRWFSGFILHFRGVSVPWCKRHLFSNWNCHPMSQWVINLSGWRQTDLQFPSPKKKHNWHQLTRSTYSTPPQKYGSLNPKTPKIPFRSTDSNELPSNSEVDSYLCSYITLDIQTSPEKVFGPPNYTEKNTFSEGIWMSGVKSRLDPGFWATTLSQPPRIPGRCPRVPAKSRPVVGSKCWEPPNQCVIHQSMVVSGSPKRW